MGQHKIAERMNNPNPEHYEPTVRHILCLVCSEPSARFIMNVENSVRVAKTMVRITTKKNDHGIEREMTYVHEGECLQKLVGNWASYIVDDKVKEKSWIRKP